MSIFSGMLIRKLTVRVGAPGAIPRTPNLAVGYPIVRWGVPNLVLGPVRSPDGADGGALTHSWASLSAEWPRGTLRGGNPAPGVGRPRVPARRVGADGPTPRVPFG